MWESLASLATSAAKLSDGLLGGMIVRCEHQGGGLRAPERIIGPPRVVRSSVRE